MTAQFSAGSPDDLPSPETLAEISGLDYIRGILEGRFAGAPIVGLLNGWIHAVDEGEVTFHGRPAFSHLNPLGTVHGGWFGTLLDSAMACAIQTRCPAGVGSTTLEYKVNITRALKPGTLVSCTARAQHVGRSTAVAEAELRGVDDTTLYATGSTTCLILRP